MIGGYKMKKEYIAPECELIRIQLKDTLMASPLNPNDPQNPSRDGQEGSEVEFDFP